MITLNCNSEISVEWIQLAKKGQASWSYSNPLNNKCWSEEQEMTSEANMIQTVLIMAQPYPDFWKYEYYYCRKRI